MTRTLSRYRTLIALAVLSSAARMISSRSSSTPAAAPLSSAAVSAELARMVGFGMV
ncbi:hypothetical protein [Burkholderia gladioli]|uniref:hypothetical protein n=1 Tax=Burkholderia gladioli TaxID=28095 RepID=UPI0015E300D2|nr:hypothetical protein [Burkholderia gladioli]MBJ9662309.1 hypothetical protein [Burkholderia gladioli]MBU9215043.1 hypothetical protein [Burkholderia gladioli]MDN7722648.1 hypothetical protein [Burkholderia gladioli]MDN7921559.1 hypothetical protein [Burkholderia gladioli]